MSLFDSVKRWRESMRAPAAKPAQANAPAREHAYVPAPSPASEETAPIVTAVLAPSADDVSDSAIEAAAAEPVVDNSYQGPERREKNRIKARPGTRVLIVDDSTTVVTVLRKMLQQNGYQTYEAYTAEEALELARDLVPDVIFLDIVLPGMDGFAALRALRREPVTKAIPVIMISGNMQATEQFYVQRIGADDFMKKPFSRPEVFVRIERLLDNEGVPRRVGMQLPASS